MHAKNHSISMPNILLLFCRRIYWTWHTAKKIWFPLGDGNSQIHICKATEIQMRNYIHQQSKRDVFPTALLMSGAVSTKWPTPPTGVQSLQISLLKASKVQYEEHHSLGNGSFLHIGTIRGSFKAHHMLFPRTVSISHPERCCQSNCTLSS